MVHWVLVLACLQEPARTFPESEAKALIERYLKATPGDERASILAEVEALPALPRSRVSTLRKWIADRALPKACSSLRIRLRKATEAVSLPEVPHGLERRRFRFRGEEAEYYLYLPGRITGPKPLVVGLHGAGVDGMGSSKHWIVAESKDVIGLFPTVLPSQRHGWDRANEAYVLALIEEIQGEFPVDANRVYLFGHSMGGGGAWAIGGHHAERFAAICASAGFWSEEGLLRNLHDTPAYFWHGADDDVVKPEDSRRAAALFREWGYPHLYREYEGIGHGNPPEGVGAAVKWVLEKRRNPIPKRLVWHYTEGGDSHHYWLKARMGRGGSVRAVLERNTITLTTEGEVRDLAVLLNESMVNFDKPITVSVDGEKRFEGKAPGSVAALLESIAERRDGGMVYSAMIAVPEGAEGNREP